ncbi:MAG: hypothetical protein ACQEUZ_15530 [Pseudomonadota bacterium]
MWEITTSHLALEEGEARRVLVETEAEGGGDPVLVLVESLEEEGRAPEVAIDGVEGVENRSATPAAWLCAGRLAGGARAIFVGLKAKVSGFVRVTIARFRRAATRFGAQLPCRICKELVKLLLSALAAQLGVPAATAAVVDLSGYDADDLEKWLGQLAGAQDFGLAAAIRRAMDAVGWLFQITDATADFACRAAGFCRPAP